MTFLKHSSILISALLASVVFGEASNPLVIEVVLQENAVIGLREEVQEQDGSKVIVHPEDTIVVKGGVSAKSGGNYITMGGTLKVRVRKGSGSWIDLSCELVKDLHNGSTDGSVSTGSSGNAASNCDDFEVTFSTNDLGFAKSGEEYTISEDAGEYEIEVKWIVSGYNQEAKDASKKLFVDDMVTKLEVTAQAGGFLEERAGLGPRPARALVEKAREARCLPALSCLPPG